MLSLKFFLIFLLGLSFGSFLNAWVWRIWQNIRITHGRSMCPKCHHQLKWYDNIPLFSFLFLKGRCRVCKNTISKQYPIVELSVALLFVLVGFKTSGPDILYSPEILRDWIILINLTFIFLYDFNYGEIWDSFTIPSSIVLFAASIAMEWQTWQSMLIGVAVGVGIFLFQYVISKGKWVGGGDIRLGLLMGVILGWPRILVALILAYVFGAVISLIQIALKKKELKSATPFGIYLTSATLVAMLWGEEIVAWYVGLLH